LCRISASTTFLRQRLAAGCIFSWFSPLTSSPRADNAVVAQFSGIGSLSPILWLTRGYAVLDGPTFPIIGEGEEEANDTYCPGLK
jgi:hypothetical protein